VTPGYDTGQKLGFTFREQSAEEQYDKCKVLCFRCRSGKRCRRHGCCFGNRLPGADAYKSSRNEPRI
jgi:hypothetical protein